MQIRACLSPMQPPRSLPRSRYSSQKVADHFSYFQLTQGNSRLPIQTACLSSKAEYLALGGTDGLIEIWDFNKMKLDTVRLPYQGKELYMVHNSPILALDFSQDERLLVSGDKTGTIKVWKVADGKRLRQINIELS